jgi:hypothetical protein
MDFVEYLIQEGYGEEEIGDILECLYIIEDIDSENLIEEVLLEKNLKLAAIEQAIKALKNMPKNAWVTRQLAKLRLARQKATKVAADKADDVAAKAGDGVTSTRPGPEGSTTYRPGSKTTPTKPTKPTKSTKSGKGQVVAAGAGAAAGSRGLWNKIPGWVKTGAGLAGGAAVISQIPSLIPGGDKEGDKEEGGGKDTPTSPSTPTTQEPPKSQKMKMAYGWWKNIKPRRGYAAQPGLSAYRNVRQNINAGDLLLGYLLSEGHAETIEEAIYVANQLDEDFISEIINEEI